MKPEKVNMLIRHQKGERKNVCVCLCGESCFDIICIDIAYINTSLVCQFWWIAAHIWRISIDGGWLQASTSLLRISASCSIEDVWHKLYSNIGYYFYFFSTTAHLMLSLFYQIFSKLRKFSWICLIYEWNIDTNDTPNSFKIFWI